MIIVARGDATALPFPDDSIPCIVTSPPYNMGIDYQGYMDSLEWGDYITMVHNACSEFDRVLMPGGRVWVNVPPAAPLSDGVGMRMDVATIWANGLSGSGRLKYRDTIVWRQDSHSGACQWGSWLSPSAPNLRGEWEAILCFFKHQWKRPRPAHIEPGWKAPRAELGGDWTDLCRNLWTIRPARKTWSPAPFPLELPARAIRLSTWPGEVVLDPFGGGGTTAEAADALGRVGISLDISAKQTEITRDRLTNLFGGT